MTRATPTVGVGLMCKPPRPGASKTRLAATIGADAATRLSRAFLQDCAATVMAAADLAELMPVAFYRPVDAASELSAILGPRWPLVFSDSGDLGATMIDTLRYLLSRSPDGAMILGADVPLLSAHALADAAQALRQGDDRTVVLIPSADGGYCLIGIRSAEAAAPLFEPMPWSCNTVLPTTLERIALHGLTAAFMPVQRDIAEIDDLRWLQSELQRGLHDCPSTRAAIDVLAETLGYA